MDGKNKSPENKTSFLSASYWSKAVLNLETPPVTIEFYYVPSIL